MSDVFWLVLLLVVCAANPILAVGVAVLGAGWLIARALGDKR